MQDRTRRLWDQEINIVEGGLDEDQVVGFVSELMSKYRALVERQVHFVSLGTLSEKTAAEADKLAEEIKNRAREEAEANAKIIVGNASQRAQELLASAKKSAQDVNRKEVDSILEGAYRKASVIDTEAKQRAQLFLLKARVEIEEDLKEQFRNVYNQLLAALRDLLSEGHDIETGWKGKLVELWKKEALELGGFEAMPSLLAAEMAKAASSAGLATEITIEMPKDEVLQRDEVIREVPVAPPAVAEVEVPAAVGAEMPAAEGVVTPAPVVENTVAREQEAAGREVPALAGVAEMLTENLPGEEVKASSASTEAGSSDILDGEVEITLVPPIEMATMSKIYDQLQSIPEVKILRTVGSRDRGPTITILLEKQIPLVEMLVKIPGVEATPDQAEKTMGVPGLKSRGKRIALKTQPG